jgi:hypothetical protein
VVDVAGIASLWKEGRSVCGFAGLFLPQDAELREKGELPEISPKSESKKTLVILQLY